MNIELEINGFKYKASFTQKEIDNVYIPLLKNFKGLREKVGKRVIIFLAAPPAVGKSTLALFLEKLSREIEGLTPIQSLSLDGFHYNNDYLKSHKILIEEKQHSLYEIKGMPETFDLENFKTHLCHIKDKNIKWPIYDRVLHNPVMDRIKVTADIVLIEGNWLLLDESQWRELKNFSDYSIFIQAKEHDLKHRLIERKIRGGLTYEEALDFYKRTDRKNILRVMENRVAADLTLEMLETGEKILK
jgi:pantothenate kinase